MLRAADVRSSIGTAVTIPRAEQRTVRSVRGDEYRLLVAWPEADAPAQGFPVIYVLDADTTFATFVEAIRMRARRTDSTAVVPAVVVGVAYPDSGESTRARRLFDYTLQDSSADGGRETGGSADFLAFIDGIVKPLVAQSYAVDSARQSLFGHSLGGRFALDVLCGSPASFEAYVAVSPSVWWKRDQLFDAVDALGRDAVSHARNCRVMVTVGEYEQRLAPWQVGQAGAEAIARRRRERRMVDDAREIVARLGSVCKQVCFEELDDEDHASVVTTSVGRALRFCLAPGERR